MKTVTLFLLTALLLVPLAVLHAAEIPVWIEPDAPSSVQIVAREHAGYLQRLYPNAAGKRVRLVTNLPTPESYEITATENEAVIAGVRTVVSELIAYSYARFIFHAPRE